MAHLLRSPSQRRRPPPPPLGEQPFCPIVDNTIFLWLDTCETDFQRFRNRFCKETPILQQQWLFFDKPDECYRFIERSISIPRKGILVTSGRLGQGIIENLHHCEQLDSVYIYCKDIEKYKEFAQHYKKVLGVYSDPVELFSRLRNNLDKKAEDTPSSTSSQFFPDSDNIERFSQPHLNWNPWEMNTCTKILPIKGQATIAVMQTCVVPFELILSTADKLTGLDGKNNYSIVLLVNKREVTLGTYYDDQARLLDRSDDCRHILQLSDNNEEHTYWLSFSKETLTVTYGIGEIRPKFNNLQAHLDEKHLQLISNIIYLHIKINGIYQDFHKIDHLEEKIHFSIGTLPFLEPNLLILRKSNSLLSNSSFSSASGISPLTLTEPCRLLYHNVVHFKFDDDDFPDFIPAIERSIRNPQGWCFQKLLEKSNRFGRPKHELTSIRLTSDSLVIEIWPTGHYSPIHNHKNAYGMFRVLYGSILIRLYPALTRNLRRDSPIEYLIRQDQVTWMLPTLNQTHQMKNIELNSCCIVVQCYSYDNNDDQKKKHEEIFDYIADNTRVIQPMKPVSDMNFGVFKDNIRKEWDERQTM